MRSVWPGYRSCGAHGSNGFGYDLIDLNCIDCARPPKRKGDGEYVVALRRLYKLPDLIPLQAGEQLRLDGC